MTSTPGGDTYDVYKRDITYDRTSAFRLVVGQEHVTRWDGTSVNDANVSSSRERTAEGGLTSPLTAGRTYIRKLSASHGSTGGQQKQPRPEAVVL